MGYKSFRPYHNPSKEPQMCRICRTEKPATHFWKESRKKNGLRSACRRCEKKSNQKFINVPDHRERKYSDNRKYARLPKYRYAISRCRARRKLMEFSIPLDVYTLLITKPCHYCGGPLNETAVGLDRMDNTKGYITENVVPCCKECNEIKGDTLTYDEAIVAIHALTEHRKIKSEVKRGLLTYSEPLQR